MNDDTSATTGSGRAMQVANTVIGALGPDRSLTERVALFAAAASVGQSFEPGLQPRRTIDQAIETGVISATTLSAVTVAQSAIESVGRLVTRGRTDTASSAALDASTRQSGTVKNGPKMGSKTRKSTPNFATVKL